MDNVKTGAFIRERRKAKDMTQKDLAQLLHVTDRAVSKWERGLCAPDLSVLEPLAQALDVSVLELIKGEFIPHGTYSKQEEESAKQVIDYSKQEIIYKLEAIKKTYLGTAAACLTILAAILGLILWNSGRLFVIDRAQSPDGAYSVTVYDKALSSGGFSWKDAVSLIVKEKGGATWYSTYENCTYHGLWWSPDSKKYVLALEDSQGPRLLLRRMEQNSTSNLSAYLSMPLNTEALNQSGNTGIHPEIEYQFLQWGLDSQSMLIYYAFSDQAVETQRGYFWYNCEYGTVSAVFPLSY